MQCYGSGVPTGGDTTKMELYWKDYSYSTTYTIQTATQVSLPTTYIPAASGTVNAALPTKRFDSQGMKAFYTFSLSASSELDVNSRIYFDFHFNVGGKLDK